MNPLRRHYTKIDDEGHTVEVFEDSWLYVAYESVKRFLISLLKRPNEN